MTTEKDRIAEGPGSAAAAYAGRQIGEWAAQQWGARLHATFEEGKALTGPLGRALVDAFIVDGLVGVVWPSVIVLTVILVFHAIAVAIDSREAERVLTGSAALLALLWSAYGVVCGVRVSWPHARMWLATLLPPVAHVRLLLFHAIRAMHHRWQQSMPASGYAAVALREALRTLQAQTGLTPDRAAFAIADHLAPLLLRHLAARVGMALLPVVGAVCYYRLVIYPEIVQQGTDTGPWTLALYPLAALADWVFGSAFRSALILPH